VDFTRQKVARSLCGGWSSRLPYNVYVGFNSQKQLQAYNKHKHALAVISRSALCCHSNETRAPYTVHRAPWTKTIVLHFWRICRGNPLYHSPNLHPGPCSSVGMRRGTDRHTHTWHMWPIYTSRCLPCEMYNNTSYHRSLTREVPWCSMKLDINYIAVDIQQWAVTWAYAYTT